MCGRGARRPAAPGVTHSAPARLPSEPVTNSGRRVCGNDSGHGAVSAPSRRCWCKPLGWPDTQVFLDGGRALAMSFPPAAPALPARACAPGWTGQPLGPPGPSPDPCSVSTGPRLPAAPRAARPAQLSARLPEVHFQQQVGTLGSEGWGWGCGSGGWEGPGVQAQG